MEPQALIGEMLAPEPIGRAAVTVRRWGAEAAVISNDGILADRTAASFLVPGSCSEELSPVLYAIPPQILSHDLSHLEWLDPDSPRGLSKVTETW